MVHMVDREKHARKRVFDSLLPWFRDLVHKKLCMQMAYTLCKKPEAELKKNRWPNFFFAEYETYREARGNEPHPVTMGSIISGPWKSHEIIGGMMRSLSEEDKKKNVLLMHFVQLDQWVIQPFVYNPKDKT